MPSYLIVGVRGFRAIVPHAVVNFSSVHNYVLVRVSLALHVVLTASATVTFTAKTGHNAVVLKMRYGAG